MRPTNFDNFIGGFLSAYHHSRVFVDFTDISNNTITFLQFLLRVRLVSGYQLNVKKRMCRIFLRYSHVLQRLFDGFRFYGQRQIGLRRSQLYRRHRVFGHQLGVTVVVRTTLGFCMFVECYRNFVGGSYFCTII